jgi:pimeloyl-ACP methyl ester carboxylesterase
MNEEVVYGRETLPVGIRSKYVDGEGGVRIHVLEAGFEHRGKCVVLLHGFPELAYCWRKQLLPLARAGFHVLAPDLRGHGRTWGAGVTYDDDLASYAPSKYLSDTLALVAAFGYEDVVAVVGHDWGSPIAAWCARTRPEIFRAAVLLSSPFEGSRTSSLADPHNKLNMEAALAGLSRPRKYYQWYYATREANEEMWHAPQGVHDFLRAYYHVKCADWPGNRPFALKSWSASELAQMPSYYVMDLDKGMADTVALEMPSRAQITMCQWLPDAELQVCSAEYVRTGFQGGLQLYRVATDPLYEAELHGLSDGTIDVPCCFIAGARDWGVYQSPGAFEAMQNACTRMLGVHLVEGAGHWVQQEQPDPVNQLLIGFLRRVSG